MKGNKSFYSKSIPNLQSKTFRFSRFLNLYNDDVSFRQVPNLYFLHILII